jgi:hypothetical protein
MTQTASVGIIEEAEPVETNIVETLGFRLLQKRIRKSEAERSSGATAETIETPDLHRAAQENAGYVGKGMAWTRQATRKVAALWYESRNALALIQESSPAPTRASTRGKGQILDFRGEPMTLSSSEDESPEPWAWGSTKLLRPKLTPNQNHIGPSSKHQPAAVAAV